MPMEDIDKNEVSDEGISDDEDLMMREVVRVTQIFSFYTITSRRFSEMEIIFKG